jgi:hypothetical protein
LTGAAVLSLSRKEFASILSLHCEVGERGSDATLLDQMQRASFDFFWNEADPKSGLVRDRANADGGDTRRMSSIAATGFGLTALCIAHRRRYLAEAEIVERVRRTLRFVAHDAPHVHGFLYHYTDLSDGKRFGGSEISPIDMAILISGVLTCREYFQDEEIAKDAARIYERVEWPWALDGGTTMPLSWTPEAGFTRLRWDTFSECILLYMLAIGSPTYPVSPDCWHAVQRPRLEYGKYRYISTPAPLFVHQFPQAWFDLRGKRDEYTNYFENSVAAVRAHRQFCMDLSPRFGSYSENLWGITASDSCQGYVAWGGPPLQGPVDGTIVPAAAAGSLPFLFRESMAVLRNLRQQYGERIWKRYGFVDAFNPLTGWADSDVVGIDVGISLLMAENARTQFVWETFMRGREAQAVMRKCGFKSGFRAAHPESWFSDQDNCRSTRLLKFLNN